MKGEFKIIDLKSGKKLFQKKFQNDISCDNIIALLGICRACRYCLENNYKEKIFCSNETAHLWATTKKFKPNVPARHNKRQAILRMKILHSHDFNEVIALWDVEWGNLRHYLKHLDVNRGVEEELPW